MAYTKQTWNCGDEITAEKLNHIEDGIENAGGGTDTLVLRVARNEGNCTYYDHTWQEVHDALANGQRCVLIWEPSPTDVSLYEIMEAAFIEDEYLVFYTFIDTQARTVLVGSVIAEDADGDLQRCALG